MKFLRKLKANLLGYFWMPCPICGEDFAGFEIGKGHLKVSSEKTYCCCKKCDYYAGIIAGRNDEQVFVPEYIAKFIHT